MIGCCCLGLAASAAGRRITTSDGLAAEGELADVQQAFIDAGAVQCGVCTPGLLVAIDRLLDDHPDPEELTVQEAISGNLCRCTGYGRLLAAVQLAAAGRRGNEHQSVAR